MVKVSRPNLNSFNNNRNNNNNGNISNNNNNNFNNNFSNNNDFNNNNSNIPINPILNHPIINNNNYNNMNNNNNNMNFNSQNNFNNNNNMLGFNNNMNNINMLGYNSMNNNMNNINMLGFNSMNNNIINNNFINNGFNNNNSNNNINNISRMNNINNFNSQNNIMQNQNQQQFNPISQSQFNCKICKNRVNKPKMCRFCQELFCSKCIIQWVNSKGHCFICKSKLTNNDLINTPLDENSINNFNNNSKLSLQKVDKTKNRFKSTAYGKQIKKNNNNFNSVMNSFNNNNNNIINNIINEQEAQDENPGLCPNHNSRMEYFCVQCNKYYCSNCLVIFGPEANRHKNHFIFQISQMNSLGIQEVINEYKKLSETKNNIDNLIGLCNLKLKENKIKRCEFEDHMNIIKDNYMKKMDENIEDIQGIVMGLKSQKEKIENSIGSIPNGFNNIVNSNDYAQGNVMSEELKKMNKIDDNLERNLKEKQKFPPKLSVENFETETIEFPIKNAGQYIEGLEIFSKNINIQNNTCKLNIKYLQKKVFVSLCIDINMPLNSPDFPKFYSYITIQNQKYGLEFSNLSTQALPQNSVRRNIQQINSTEFDFDQFVFMSGEDKKIKMKIYIMKICFKK